MICGSQYGTAIIASGDYVQLRFYSDSGIQKKGFNISFIALPKPGEYNQNNIMV